MAIRLNERTNDESIMVFGEPGEEGDVELAGEADAGIWVYAEAVRVNDPGALWLKHNPWIDPDCRWDVAFLLLREQQISAIRFVPFDNPEYRHGIRPLDDAQNLARWRALSDGASNANQRVYRALVRRLPQ